jgi:hypothetical protein
MHRPPANFADYRFSCGDPHRGVAGGHQFDAEADAT